LTRAGWGPEQRLAGQHLDQGGHRGDLAPDEGEHQGDHDRQSEDAPPQAQAAILLGQVIDDKLSQTVHVGCKASLVVANAGMGYRMTSIEDALRGECDGHAGIKVE